MAGPFSFTGWSTQAVAPTPLPPQLDELGRPVLKTGHTYDKVQPKGLPTGVYSVTGPGGKYNTLPTKTVPKPEAAPATETSSVAPTSNFSFSGWTTSRLVPKAPSVPVVQGTAGNIPANAIPVGTASAGAGNIPDTIQKAQSTLETFSNPSLLSFFSSLLENQGNGGGGMTLVNAVAPGQAQLNARKLSLIDEPARLAAQVRDLQARQAALGPAPFGTYMNSEQQRIADQLVDVQTRYQPAVTAATAAGGLGAPYRTISAPNQQGLRRNASGWLASPWM